MTVRASLALAVAVALGAAVGAPSPAEAQVGAEQASREFARTYGVRVLKARTGTIGGKPVILLTVMNPEGDFDEAFQVTTVAVDRATGRLVAGFRHRASGRVDNQAPIFEPNRQPTGSLSRGTSWR